MANDADLMFLHHKRSLLAADLSPKHLSLLNKLFGLDRTKYAAKMKINCLFTKLFSRVNFHVQIFVFVTFSRPFFLFHFWPFSKAASFSHFFVCSNKLFFQREKISYDFFSKHDEK